jgi:hypothetical protein
MAVKAEAEAVKKAAAVKKFMVSLFGFLKRNGRVSGFLKEDVCVGVADTIGHLTFVFRPREHPLTFSPCAKALGTTQKMRQDSTG